MMSHHACVCMSTGIIDVVYCNMILRCLVIYCITNDGCVLCAARACVVRHTWVVCVRWASGVARTMCSVAAY
jgi:hypothetical protein